MIGKFKLKVLRTLNKELTQFNTIHKDLAADKTLTIKGSQIAKSVKIGSDSKIVDSKISGNTNIGLNNVVQNSSISGSISTKEGCKIFECTIGGRISLGRYTSLWGPYLQINTGKQQVTIGSFCSIARNVFIQTYNHNNRKLSTYFVGQNVFKEKWENERVSNGDIHIENDVWIGANVTILGGVTIGNGALIAANTVVTKDIPPFAIVAGIPAKVIKYRFDKPTIDKIQELAWWDWPMDKIRKNKSLFKEELPDINFDISKIIE